jgi:hypothetical protein
LLFWAAKPPTKSAIGRASLSLPALQFALLPSLLGGGKYPLLGHPFAGRGGIHGAVQDRPVVHPEAFDTEQTLRSGCFPENQDPGTYLSLEHPFDIHPTRSNLGSGKSPLADSELTAELEAALETTEDHKVPSPDLTGEERLLTDNARRIGVICHAIPLRPAN